MWRHAAYTCGAPYALIAISENFNVQPLRLISVGLSCDFFYNISTTQNWCWLAQQFPSIAPSFVRTSSNSCPFVIWSLVDHHLSILSCHQLHKLFNTTCRVFWLREFAVNILTPLTSYFCSVFRRPETPATTRCENDSRLADQEISRIYRT
jgi:hypothetical protein